MTAKDLEYYINLVDVAVGVYEYWVQFWKNFYCKMLSSSISFYREIIHERKSRSDAPNFNTYFKKLPEAPNLQ